MRTQGIVARGLQAMSPVDGVGSMKTGAPPSDALLRAAARLRNDVDQLSFSAPISHVYNPLRYAWEAHTAYLRRYCSNRKRVVFVGMNPGPWGMVQTGIPFGEVGFARDWLGIDERIVPPENQHPKRLINGFACPRTEISGKRFWGLLAQRFGTPGSFFKEHFVVNYCPLAFLEESGRNRTPDKLPPDEIRPLYKLCDKHLLRVAEVLQPEWLIGVGIFAEDRCKIVLKGRKTVRIGRILHPSPASPAANRDWAGEATRQLEQLEVWS